ncbi:MAG: LamG domain-containing protein [Nanobdellota archaeon]
MLVMNNIRNKAQTSTEFLVVITGLIFLFLMLFISFNSYFSDVKNVKEEISARKILSKNVNEINNAILYYGDNESYNNNYFLPDKINGRINYSFLSFPEQRILGIKWNSGYISMPIVSGRFSVTENGDNINYTITKRNGVIHVNNCLYDEVKIGDKCFDNVVGYWIFSKDSGFSDLSYFGNDGICSGTCPSWDDEEKAYYFDGVDDYVNTTLTTGDVIGSGQQLTYSAWIKGSDTDEWDSIIGTRRGYDFMLTNQDGNGNAAILYATTSEGNVNNPISKKQIYDNKWHFITGTWNNGVVKLYVDGKKINETSGNGNLLKTSNHYIGIGKDIGGTGREHKGYIDKVAVFNRSLTEDEVEVLYNAGKY